MKYKLLKPLPLMKKGMVIKIDKIPGYMNIHLCNVLKRISLSPEDLNKMIRYKWIKELNNES